MLNNSNKIFTIAKYTFKEIVKSKILYNTFFLGLALLLITFIAYSFTYGEPSRVALDFGLGMLSLSSVGIAIFIGVGILAKEIENRTVYMIVSRPVPRYVFILGKYIGLGAVLVLNILILSLLTLSLFFWIGGEYQSLIHWTVFFTILESLIVLLVVGTLSLVTSQTMSVLYTLVVYVLGQGITSAMDTSFVQMRQTLMWFLEIYHYFLPGFYKLNIKEFILYKNDLDLSFIISTSSYAIVYICALLSLSILIFNKKNLD